MSTVEPARNARQVMDGRALLRALPERCAPLVFFDPQHREVLDKQGYGNEGARQKGRADLPQMSPATIAAFVVGIERVLARSGHFCVWIDKFLLGESRWRRWMPEVTALKLVDVIHWDKGRMGMGRRARCFSEYLLVFQKGPLRADRWNDRSIPDTWLEQADSSAHPHAKPLQLIRRIVLATTARGDLVVDPAAGGYGVFDVCRKTGREFVGCDLRELPVGDDASESSQR